MVDRDVAARRAGPERVVWRFAEEPGWGAEIRAGTVGLASFRARARVTLSFGILWVRVIICDEDCFGTVFTRVVVESETVHTCIARMS